MSNLVAFDTNIYFYALDSSAAAKHLIARDLIVRVGRNRSVVLLQAMGELANAITKRKPALLPAATQLIDDVAPVGIPAGFDDLRSALAVHKQHGMQFWDAVIWAVARRAGCTLLFTEDYQDGRVVDGVTFRNPFTMSSADLQSLLS